MAVFPSHFERVEERDRCYSVTMQTILPFAAVILAIFAAGCVAFIAWQLTKEASRDGKTDDDQR